LFGQELKTLCSRVDTITPTQQLGSQNIDTSGQRLSQIKSLERTCAERNKKIADLKQELFLANDNILQLTISERKCSEAAEDLSAKNTALLRASLRCTCKSSELPSSANDLTAANDMNDVNTSQVDRPTQSAISETTVVNSPCADDAASKNSNNDVIIIGASNSRDLKPHLLSKSLKRDVMRKSCGNIDAAFDEIVSYRDSPGHFVLSVGTNDLRDTQYSAKEIADYYVDMLKAVMNRPFLWFACLRQGLTPSSSMKEHIILIGFSGPRLLAMNVSLFVRATISTWTLSTGRMVFTS
jgi:hypothetical protein